MNQPTLLFWTSPCRLTSVGQAIAQVDAGSITLSYDDEYMGLVRTTAGLIALLLWWVPLSAQPSTINRDPHYPAHWWTPISDPKKPDWEILPQEAGPSEVILSKRNELGLLSNFAATPFIYHGKRYASLEGFWQMMLYPDGPNDPRAKSPGIEWKYTREQVSQMTAFEAKSAGTLAEQNMQKMGINWVTFAGKRFKYRSLKRGEHHRLIVEATREKVKQNPEVKRVLLATGNLILKPDHYGEINAPPEWRYYEILMMIRKELQSNR